MNVFLRSKQLNVTIVEYRSYANSKRKVSFGRKERLARGHAGGQSNENHTNTMIALTLCHCRPTKTPTRFCVPFIGVEVDFHFVRFGRYYRRLEVIGIRWIRVAAAVVHQGRPVPIGDSDKVVEAATITITMDGKGGEFKPQYLSCLHNDVFNFVNVIRIVVRMVW